MPLDEPLVEPATQAAGPPEAEVLVAWPELRRGRTLFDAFVTREHLVLVPVSRGVSRGALSGLAQQTGLGSGRIAAAAHERVREVLRTPLAEVARRPGVRTLRWDDLPSVEFRYGSTQGWVLRFPRQARPLDRLKARNESLVTEPTSTAALLRRLVGDRLHSKH